VAVAIAIATAVTVELHDENSLPVGWDDADLRVARPSATRGSTSEGRPR
jgi:hypothetical protein